jgi:hypothetical protein
VDKTAPALVAGVAQPAQGALGKDYNNDGRGNGFNVPSLLGIHASPPYLHNGACETLACVVSDINHRTARGTLPDVLRDPEKQAQVVLFLESITAATERLSRSLRLATSTTAPLALGHIENEPAGPHSTAERQEGQAARQRQEGSPQSTGLILLADEGERMVRRWGLPMTIKVDPRNGGSQHLVVGTEGLPPGKAIPVHKHPHADEVVLLLQGVGCERAYQSPAPPTPLPSGAT